MRREELKQFFGDTFLLWPVLLIMAVVLGAEAVGLEVPLIERSMFWKLQQEPGISAGVAALIVVAILLLLPGGGVSRLRRVYGVMVTLGIAGLASYMVFSPGLGSTFLLSAVHLYHRYKKSRAGEASEPAPAGPRVSLLVLIIPACAALLATLVTCKLQSGYFLPPAPEQRFLRAREYSSATPVVSVPEGQAPRSLRIHPRLTREQVRENSWREGGGWSIGEVLHKLHRSGKLQGLPVTDERRVQALLEPALASGLLVTAEGLPAVDHGLWGVVAEAEGLKGTRRVFLSLGAGTPTRAFSPYYHFLFEEPAGGGPLRLIEAENVFPSDSGYEGIEPPGLFIIYLLVFLVLAMFVSVLRTARSPHATTT
ncbi:hypothetical protein BO221_15345 [Archangium sp. Cb G35]|uniref:hypothetical protein n=1 Tax=Archangium sp. Cb G35 TaxID=1920190 RepID=UPI000937EF4F|nr:hypothetical protein [Archangium sp. Cb G35]OJT24523.1 hypothetical protein BO221_15345 [Archangium sp. Cb G35]